MTGWLDHTAISESLQPGERIIWLGKPDPWSAASRQAFPLIFLSIWTCGILFAAWAFFRAPNRSSTPVDVAAFALFFGVGVNGWYRAWRGLRNCWTTTYALTNRRVIIAIGGDMQSLTGAALGDLSRIGDANRGSLVFGGGAPFPFYARRSGVFGYANGLYGIDDPKRVEALIYEHLIMPKKEKGASG